MVKGLKSQAIFWHKEEDCPVVYIAGACFQPSAAKARASYGVYWGWNDERNTSGAVIGEQNDLRAELSGLKRALELAIEFELPSLVIRTKMKQLDAELDAWEAATATEKRFFRNNDLLYKIDELSEQARDQRYFLGEPAPLPDYQTRAYFVALNIARDHGKLGAKKQTALQTVAIFGACVQEGQANSKATWSNFWGVGDVRNSTGPVENAQTHLRAVICGLRAALQTAVDEKIPRVQILTRCQVIKTFVETFAADASTSGVGGKAKELVAECKVLAEQLDKLFVSFIPTETKNPMLDEAKAMISVEKPPKTPKKVAGEPSKKEDLHKIFDQMDKSLFDDDEEEFEVHVRPPATAQKKSKKQESQKKGRRQQKAFNLNESLSERVRFRGDVTDFEKSLYKRTVSYAVPAENYYVNVSL